MTRRLAILASLLALGLYSGIPRVVHAAPAGITLAPSIQELTLGAADTDQSLEISITNHTAAVQTFKLFAIDFGSLNDTGGILFAGSDSNNLIKKYGLAKWIALPESSVAIPALATAKIPITIRNDSSLQPGGHYAAIMAAAQTAGMHEGTSIGVDQTVSSLILAKKIGGEHYDLRLNKVEQNGNWLHMPSTVKLIFYDPGNVHVVPRGTVRVAAPNGTVVSEGIINEESGYLLPETHRQLYVPLRTLQGIGLWPGFYKLEITYRYGGLGRSVTYERMIFFVNLPGLLLTLGLLATAGWALYFSQKQIRHLHKQKPKKSTNTSDDTGKPPKLVLRM
jgi:hypothetical protein